jgi:signal transduction histidine kinase
VNSHPAASAPPPSLDELAERLVTRLHEALAQALPSCPEAASPALTAALTAVVQEHVREVEHRLAQAERFALIGRMSAALAHELRNPLSVIETSAFILAERGREDERVARHTRRIAEQVGIASALVSDLLDAARERPPAGSRADLAAVARAAVAQVPCPAGASVTLKLPSDLPAAFGDERRIRQVLTNLLHNALEAIGNRGAIVVSAGARGGLVAVTITDDGPGIPPELLPRVFDPLFTTKPRGTGLGLALSRAIARAHGGDLVADNAPGGGARFELTLPRAAVPGGAT